MDLPKSKRLERMEVKLVDCLDRQSCLHMLLVVTIPEGQSEVNIKVDAPDGSSSKIIINVFRPAGTVVRNILRKLCVFIFFIS
jgi:hypothetical protein